MTELLAIPLWQITQVIFSSLPVLVVSPTHALFFWLLVAFVAMQHRRLADLEQGLYGRTRIRPLPATLMSVAHGLLGGVLASYLLVLTGTALGQADIGYLWPLAVLLMLIHPRFICFSYAGGLIALSSLISGWPSVNIPGLIGLVATLHIVEAVLVWLGSDESAVPIYVRHGSGAVVGGFHVQRFWPVPLVAVLIMSIPQELQNEAIAMPDWWPLIGGAESLLSAPEIGLVLWPVAAALGYSDIALSREPGQRSRRAAVHLLSYSLILLALAIIGSYWRPGLWLAALASGGLHELMIQVGLRSEFGGKPRFRHPERGVLVLDVFPDAMAADLGLQRGDIILDVNGKPLNSRRDLADVLATASFFLAMTVRRDQQLLVLETNRFRYEPGAFGIVTAPEIGDAPHVQIGHTGPLQRAWQQLRSGFRRR